MIQKPRLIYSLLFFCVIGERLQSADPTEKIHATVYPGIESNLIVWEFKEETNTDSLVLFRTSSLRNSFDLLAKIPAVPNRYLDEGISPNHRYFYQLISEDQLTSDTNAPPFGRPLKNNDEVIELLAQINNSLISNINNLFKSIVENHIKNSELISLGINPKVFTQLLTGDTKQMFPWVSHFSVQHIFKMESILTDDYWKTVLKMVEKDLNIGKPYFKNRFLLTSKEWDDRRNHEVQNLSERIPVLQKSFKEEVKILKSQNPVRVSWLRSDIDQIWVDLIVMDTENLDKLEVSLNASRDIKWIDIPNGVESGNVISVPIPQIWNECSLVINDFPVQSFILDFSRSEKIAVTLKNEYILNSKLENSFIIPENYQSVWINELMFDPEFQTLFVELLHEPDVIDPIRISVNSTETWVHSPVYSNESTIVDSQFIIHNSEENIIWVHLNTKPESSIPNVMTESFPLLTHTKTVWARNPIDLVWEESTHSSMGFRNQLQKRDDGTKMIPELFALYQNYPNPFNFETSIKFDLLKHSLVSLYVLNAAGHVETIYLENEDLTPGHYSFIWQGNSHSSGVYFVTLQAILEPFEPVIMSRKMIYLK